LERIKHHFASFFALLNKAAVAEECDARNDEKYSADGSINLKSKQLSYD